MRDGGAWEVSDDQNIIGTVSSLVDEEHRLRTEAQQGRIASEEEQRRLADIEARLDQCWDLLRRRRARREIGDDPDAASPAPVAEVENYQQ
ncbi:hypothetical protein SACE_2925 [Saccharopolyspora erythraea NRRL 2338]|uniref:DUF2630 family protein n=1 Tax=Saccharopolyspora erythraea (strain ATCC 11635 / DSM 40517 / JCM 4748 / NBRC 13426 / NCIMB 8594 / NRRL 2338) TaxID=405948 RepID=A4FDS8_SACEN|nr:hypothetical protein N599_18690 [Saccharopolyspora erythraea D]CAM02203.1 hypothetical protein SACE_2925 [Saccharopolyspora erythraea NRRL 2338]